MVSPTRRKKTGERKAEQAAPAKATEWDGLDAFARIAQAATLADMVERWESSRGLRREVATHSRAIRRRCPIARVREIVLDVGFNRVFEEGARYQVRDAMLGLLATLMV